MQARTVKQQHPALRDDIGDLTTRRPLPGPVIEQLDPFLFLNHHGPQTYPPNNLGLPFGPHPHRGFETVTFILEGELAHRDSGGHESVIVKPYHLIELHDDGDAVGLVAAAEAVVLLGHAVPLREPVVAHSPFVMNTREEILQAITDYQAGKFGGGLAG
jgi:redox-sensitive bicupin YhaK (pirin superfamily)